jgi:hypothetical protein
MNEDIDFITKNEEIETGLSTFEKVVACLKLLKSLINQHYTGTLQIDFVNGDMVKRVKTYKAKHFFLLEHKTGKFNQSTN